MTTTREGLSQSFKSGRPRCRLTSALVWWLLATIALMAVGWMKNISLVLLMSYLLVVLVGVNAWIAYRMVRRVAVSRLRTGPIFAREHHALTREVSNMSAGPAVVTIREKVEEKHWSWFLPALPPQAVLPLASVQTFDRRGRYSGKPVEAISGYPFGLLKWQREVCAGAEIVVLPALGVVNLAHLQRWLIRHGPAEGQIPRPTVRHAPADGDVRGLRPYRRGDSPRDVHWRSSARRGQLLVREYDQSAPFDLTIILDVGRSRQDDGESEQMAKARLEWALSLTMSVAWAWAHADIPGGLTLVIPGHPPATSSGASSPGFVRQAFAPLADLTTIEDSQTLPALAVRSSRRTLRWLVSTRTDGPVLAELRRMGVMVAVSSPTLRPVWYTPPVGVDLPGTDGE